jgi:hypothetical protein
VTSIKAIKFAAWSLWIVAMVGGAYAQTETPKVTMHRQAAGELDDSGWTTATSTKGAYSVKLPGKFNDFTVLHESPKSLLDQAHMLSSTMLQGIRFTTTRLHFHSGLSTARKQFEKIKAPGGKSPYKSLKRMNINNYEAIEGEIQTKRGSLVQRSVLLDEDLFTMIVEYPKSQETVVKRLAPLFFDSVTFD